MCVCVHACMYMCVRVHTCVHACACAYLPTCLSGCMCMGLWVPVEARSISSPGAGVKEGCESPDKASGTQILMS